MKFKRAGVLLAQSHWAKVLQIGHIVIDATCGRGHDSAFLASLVLSSDKGWLHCIDIQPEAIEDTKKLLEKSSGFNPNRVSYHCASHASFAVLGISKPNSVNGIVYNLGYLPRGDKTVISNPESTILSLQEAVRILMPGGILSVASYRGHPGGNEEFDVVDNYFNGLDPENWTKLKHFTSNHIASPVLFLAQKR